jgi:protein Tex
MSSDELPHCMQVRAHGVIMAHPPSSDELPHCMQVRAHGMIMAHPPHGERASAERTLREWIKEHRVSVVAVGDGTASHETVEVVAAAVRADPSLSHVRLSVVHEAGASVLSVTAAAQVADPTLDPAAIGAASLARRLQDPMAELVRVDPKSLGVGLYQHDLPPKLLDAELAQVPDPLAVPRLAPPPLPLAQVVQSAVCHVGVDLNTASTSLLMHIGGLNASRAAAIVAARPAGGFTSRASLRAIKGIGPKTFEQAAGFLRLGLDAAEPLDATAVHPESYEACRRLLAQLGHDLVGRDATARAATPSGQSGQSGQLGQLGQFVQLGQLGLRRAATPSGRTALAAACGVGELALMQLLEALTAAQRDAREELPGPLLLGSSLQTLADLVLGQRLEGVVRNITPFGCFVNVGLKDDGLLHVSQMRTAGGGRVSDPLEHACVGMPLSLLVLAVDL